MPAMPVEIDGVIRQTLPDQKFRVLLQNGRMITAHVSGKAKRSYMKTCPGTAVKVEMSPYDPTKGKIVF